MLEILRSILEVRRQSVPSVDQELARLRKDAGRQFPVFSDTLEERLYTYLEFARTCGLHQREIVLSCVDLALTLEQMWQGLELPKINAWGKARREALVKARPQRVIEMQLYPEYFSAIFAKRKVFEGRAYDPDSPKDYPDMREGDRIVFKVCREIPEWESRCQNLGINPDIPMVAEVGRIKFAPLVHWMYQLPGVEGESFQPMISGASELINLQRAAVYYSFPGYAERIMDHGFVGIEVRDPRLQA
jgi:hypothetical protein